MLSFDNFELKNGDGGSMEMMIIRMMRMRIR